MARDREYTHESLPQGENHGRFKEIAGRVLIAGGLAAIIGGAAVGLIDNETAHESTSRLTDSDVGDALVIGGFATDLAGLGLIDSAETDQPQ